jgi:hypothetical protein
MILIFIIKYNLLNADVNTKKRIKNNRSGTALVEFIGLPPGTGPSPDTYIRDTTVGIA